MENRLTGVSMHPVGIPDESRKCPINIWRYSDWEFQTWGICPGLTSTPGPLCLLLCHPGEVRCLLMVVIWLLQLQASHHHPIAFQARKHGDTRRKEAFYHASFFPRRLWPRSLYVSLGQLVHLSPVLGREIGLPHLLRLNSLLPEQDQDSVGMKEGQVTAGRQPAASATDGKAHEWKSSVWFFSFKNKKP